MSAGRIVGTVAAVVTVGACAVVVAGMAKAASDHDRQQQQSALRGTGPLAAQTIPAQAALPQSWSTSVHGVAVTGLRTANRSSGTARSSAAARASSTSPTSSAPGARSTTATHVVATPTRTAATSRPPRATASSHPVATTRTTTHAPAHTVAPPAPKPKPKPTLTRGVALPLHFRTVSATQVITVTAHSQWSTVATLQAWTKAPGGGWLRHGPAITAHIGSQGMSTAPSESKSATPIGSFTLTRAFGHDSDPGTRLPYVHTNPSYWWISQSGPLYNTMQSCWSNCAFNQGDPNEHLYYETPYYNYAVVIDYNTRNAGPVRQGAGSAFFLHVTDGSPTAGCVAIPQANLLGIMRWLSPGAHPRILIGTV